MRGASALSAARGMLAAAAVLLSLAAPSSQQVVPPLPVPPNLAGPKNGGHFRFGTVSWVKLQQQPPRIRFTVEAAFRRSFGATNFKGSGADGKLVVGDTFKPSGLETIMFDFGDGSMLTPMMFTVQAYSLAEDWVQGVSTFEHTYARLSSTTPFQYIGTFKGCCRMSELGRNADTAWALSSIMNVRDDVSSPRLSVLPVQTIIKKQRPSSANPAFYVPASDDTHHQHPQPKLKAFEIMDNIGHAPSIIGTAQAPSNLPHLAIDSASGRITIATGPIFSSDSTGNTARCLPGSRLARCQADWNPAAPEAHQSNRSNLVPGMYNAVVQLMQGNSSSPVEFMISLVEEDLAQDMRMPRLLAPDTPDIFYPHFVYKYHVAYLGFPITPLQVSGEIEEHGMQLGFTTGRLPEGVQLSTISGGTAMFGFSCINGSHFCQQSPTTKCNGTSTPSCTCVEADTGKACRGPHNSLTACRGGATCQSCWYLGTCPTSMGNLTVEWVPVTGQVGTHMFCFDVTAQRPQEFCAPGNAEFGCEPLSSPSQCVNIEVFQDPPPRIWTSYAADLDPHAQTEYAYVGRTLTFTVYADDDNCKDRPAITMGPMPPGAALAPQATTARPRSVTVTSFFGGNHTSTITCETQSRVFSWVIPHTYGGYKGTHCFHATDKCGDDEHCSGELDTAEICIPFQVAKCKYAVSLQQTIAEVAAIFGTDWIQVFNLNDLPSPDYMLFKNQVLNVGHKYVVGVGDSVLKIARRFGTTDKSINFLNYELGELNTTNLAVGQELCIIPNSCFGEVQSIWDKNPTHVDERQKF
jgi:LysM repeat protein